MSVTKRFALLPAAGLVAIIFSSGYGLHVHAFLFVNLFSLGLLALDWFITPKPSECISVTRGEQNKLYYRASNEISFTVRNNSRHALFVEAKDEAGRFFEITESKMKRRLAPYCEEIFSYKAVPLKRGAFLFPKIYLKTRGVIGLCAKHSEFDVPIEYKVYPNVTDLGRYRLMVQKNRLLRQGDKTVRLYGAGSEFESLRAYIEGDDYRKINWMATARENRLTVNQYQIEKNQPIIIMLDAGRTMSCSANGYRKLDYAVNAALILSDIVGKQRDNSGLIVFDTAVRSLIMPGKGAAHRSRLADALYHVQEGRAASDYEEAFRMLCEKQKRRAIVFVFTDFEIMDEAEAVASQLAYVRRFHMPVLTFMKNESVLGLAETKPKGKAERMLREAANEYISERKAIFQRLSALRIPHVECDAEKFAAAAVNQYLSLQARRGF